MMRQGRDLHRLGCPIAVALAFSLPRCRSTLEPDVAARLTRDAHDIDTCRQRAASIFALVAKLAEGKVIMGGAWLSLLPPSVVQDVLRYVVGQSPTLEVLAAAGWALAAMVQLYPPELQEQMIRRIVAVLASPNATEPALEEVMRAATSR